MEIRNPKTRELLRYLAVGSGIVVLSVLAPQLPYQLLKAYLRKRRFQQWMFLRDLRRLQNRKLLRFTLLPNGDAKIILSKNGQRMVLRYNIQKMKISKPKKWDKKWRLVMFDIPHESRSARDALRQTMKRLGFYQLQKSVFIYPYPCEKEIEFIAQFYGVRDHILFLTLERFEGEEKLRHSVFGL